MTDLDGALCVELATSARSTLRSTTRLPAARQVDYDRWGTLIMRYIVLGLTRYDDLQRSSGVTNATLTNQLRVLEQNDLIERWRYQSRPDRYEHFPTSKSKEVGLVLHAMVQVGDGSNVAGLDGPPLIDRGSGHGVKLALVDAETGQPVAIENVTVQAGPGADELTRWRLTVGPARKAARSK